VEVFNLGTGNGVSVLELVKTFEEATGVKVNYKIAPRRAGDVEQVYADCTKANEVLGWKAEVPLKETLLNAWNWQKHLRDLGVM
jgi:UDP-glucose 4-epimerase